jgi:translation initiation factor IF-2
MIENRGGDRRDQENALLAIKRERPTLQELMGALEEMREVNLILRADTQESLEAIKYILEKYTEDDVKVNIMMAGIGAPNESDILLASTAGATILCFSVTAAGALQKAAEQRGIAIKSYRIVYELEQEVERLLKGTREPVFEEKYLGKAEVRMLIKHPKAGVVAGSYVQDGILKRNSKAKVLRKGKVVFEGTIVGLKRFKDDVREVAKGFECGINLDWEEILEGDIIEASEMVEVVVA